MKKFLIFLFAAVLAVGTVSAQDRNERQRVNPRTPQNIEGTLKLEKGFIAVQSGESVYYVPMLTRYIGFINGLKEDAKVSIEGFLFRNIIHPVKVTIADKSYDFFAPQFAPRLKFGMQNYNFRFMHNYFKRNAPGHKERPETDRNGKRQNWPNRTEQG
jgi:hypothetical protein